jgi:hypothetical protein
MKLLLAGEGANDLGGWASEPAYRHGDRRVGVVEALLRKVQPTGWTVLDAVLWKGIPKFRAGGHRGAEMRTVLGLALQAKERGFDGFAFVRDRDSVKERQAEIGAALMEIDSVIGGAPPRAGAVAVERIESWVLAVTGAAGSEAMSDAAVDEALATLGAEAKGTTAFAAIVEGAALSAVPEDALTLRLWLEDARRLLGSPPPRP